MLTQFTVKFGSRFRMIAVFTSVRRTRIDVDIAGKPKPSAPCVSPAANMTAVAAAHIHALSTISGSMGPPRGWRRVSPALQGVRPIAEYEPGERPVDAASQCEHLEKLPHFGR